MGETSVRHVQPIKQRRSRGTRRIEAFSPKLKRRLHLSSREGESAKPWAMPPSPVRRTSSATMRLDALGSGSRMSAVKARR